MTTYGMILPIIISSGRIGDTRICSMVPRSFSLTMLSAVRIAPTIIMMTAMTPGTMKLTLFSSGLYQTRLCDLDRRDAALLRPARCGAARRSGDRWPAA